MVASERPGQSQLAGPLKDGLLLLKHPHSCGLPRLTDRAQSDQHKVIRTGDRANQHTHIRLRTRSRSLHCDECVCSVGSRR